MIREIRVRPSVLRSQRLTLPDAARPAWRGPALSLAAGGIVVCATIALAWGAMVLVRWGGAVIR